MLIEKGTLTLGHLTKLMMTHDLYHLLIGGSCDCLLYQHGACGPGATSCVWTWVLSRKSFFVKPHKRTSSDGPSWRDGIRRLASFGDSIGFRVGGFLPSLGNVGWFTTARLKTAEQRLFYICASSRMCGLYRDKSYNELVVIGITARYRSMLSHFSLSLSRVSLWGQPHVSAFNTLCLLWCLHLGKKNIVLRFFSVHALQPYVKVNINFNCP